VVAGNAGGEISVVYGDVAVKKLGAEKALPPGRGDTLFVGDTLRTGNGSRAQLLFSDGSFVNISEDTAVRVNLYLNDAAAGRRKSVVRLLNGKARFLVPVSMNRGSLFSVETETSRIATTYGDFLVAAHPGKTVVHALGGAVEVRNISFMAVGKVKLKQNRTTTVEKETPPSRPHIVDIQQRKVLIREIGEF